MTPVAARNHEATRRLADWGSLFLMVLMVTNLVVGRWKPGSIAATLLSYTFIVAISGWFAVKIRHGYRRRRPYWTRESWLRYLRLAAMPVAAVILVLAMSTGPAIRMMGAPQSTTRNVGAAILVTLLVFGAVGLVIALDWLHRGDPSEQFTRRRWISWR
jgi:small-conductance mechanosensitive channel